MTHPDDITPADRASNALKERVARAWLSAPGFDGTNFGVCAENVLRLLRSEGMLLDSPPWAGRCDEDRPWQPGDIVRDANGDLYWRTWDGREWQFLFRSPGDWVMTPNLGPAIAPLALIARQCRSVDGPDQAAVRAAYDAGWRDRDALAEIGPIEPGPACPEWKPPA